MSKITNILDSINDSAVEYRDAKSKFAKAFRCFVAEVPCLAPEHFWPIADDFRFVVLQVMHYREHAIVDTAADEFFRRAEMGMLRHDLQAAVHFALSYRHYKRLSYEGGDKCRFSFGRGDDAYGDLMDSAVMLGCEFNERLADSRFADMAEFDNAVSAACLQSVTEQRFPFRYADDPTDERVSLAGRLRRLVLNGENYCAMSLQDAAQKWIVIKSVRTAPEDQ